MPRKEFPEQYNGWYRISDARPVMGIAHAQYVRQLIGKKFQHEDVINPNTGKMEKGAMKLDMGSYKVWAINPTIVEGYNTRQATRSGLRRYMVRFDSAVMAPFDLEAALRPIVAKAYGVKPTELTDEQFTFGPAYRKKSGSSDSDSSGPFDLDESAEPVSLDFLDASE